MFVVVAVAAVLLLVVSVRPTLASPLGEVSRLSRSDTDPGSTELAFTESDTEEVAAVSDRPEGVGDWWITPALLLSFVVGAWYLAISRSRDPLE